MRRNLILILIAILIFGCNSKFENTLEDFIDNYSFNKTKSNSKEIIIKLYDTTITKRRITDVEFFASKKEFKAINKQQLENFDRLFINAEKTGYCCCPLAIYSIHFLNKKEELDLFYVDTLQFKNKVRIYEKGLQYSYTIEKQKWKDYLNEF
ncbi:hypothetical protein [Flavobacterium saccharophilum]|uniref:Lipoprotein n=1 Tax=Flavobacterium saccharophilum TaxID=29534 RepID=A0A1M7M1C9_9FLAO|nr:hypothetical protein [Flavobacterium saccharophilum]SHM84353.1 hypothetical protein SAMN05444366_4295 [Flavobacterium saccharophilum]